MARYNACSGATSTDLRNQTIEPTKFFARRHSFARFSQASIDSSAIRLFPVHAKTANSREGLVIGSSLVLVPEGL